MKTALKIVASVAMAVLIVAVGLTVVVCAVVWTHYHPVSFLIALVAILVGFSSFLIYYELLK